MEYTIFILLLPLLSFLVLGIGGKWMTHRTAGIIGTTVLAVVALLSYATAWQYFSAPRLADGTFDTVIPYNVTWLPFTPTLSIDLGILLDPISVMMLIVISTVSLMVHVYSFGYMKGERGFQRYYAFLSLFTMSMLGLVVATNIFQMYLFWELVGVSSYLLIGFYYTKPSAVAASKKAFIVTRFADLGFLIGILVYGYYAGTYTFQPSEMALLKGGASGIGTYVYRWCRQECNVPIAYLVTGCYGRPDTCQCIDPCSNDGSSRSLSCGTNVPVVHRLCTGCAAPGSLRRSVHCILRRFGSLCAE